VNFNAPGRKPILLSLAKIFRPEQKVTARDDGAVFLQSNNLLQTQAFSNQN
jgi:hypothetical protein